MKAPCVFLPGWCVGRGPLKLTVDAQNGQIFDLPGYGDAPLINDFFAAADDIALRLETGTTLIGWSLGAQLAIAIAARAPLRAAGAGGFFLACAKPILPRYRRMRPRAAAPGRATATRHTHHSSGSCKGSRPQATQPGIPNCLCTRAM